MPHQQKRTFTRLCFAPGCGQQIPPRHVGCWHHWCTLPAPLQARIIDAFKDGLRHHLNPTHEYSEAVREAMSYIRQQAIERAAISAKVAA